MTLLAATRRPKAKQTWMPASTRTFARQVIAVRGTRTRYTVTYKRVLKDGNLGVAMMTGQEGWVEWAQETMAMEQTAAQASLGMLANKLHAAVSMLKAIGNETHDMLAKELAERAVASARFA